MKRRRKLALLIVCVMAIAFGVSGCGNDESKKMSNEEKAYELAKQIVDQKISTGTIDVPVFPKDNEAKITYLGKESNNYQYKVEGTVEILHPEREKLKQKFSIIVEFDDKLMQTGDFWFSDLKIE